MVCRTPSIIWTYTWKSQDEKEERVDHLIKKKKDKLSKIDENHTDAQETQGYTDRKPHLKYQIKIVER